MTIRSTLVACLFVAAGLTVEALEVFTRVPMPDAIATDAELQRHAGDLVYWRTPETRRLTYWMQRTTFRSPSEAEVVERALRAAAQDWHEACPDCGVVFAPAAEARLATFKVQWSNYRLLTQSFYPDYQPVWRILIVGELFFSQADQYDQVGMLRHELGHILGYRHEHLRQPPDVQTRCKWSPDPPSRLPVALTPYDADSVMHYPCGPPAGKAYFRLSPLDIEGHRKLYRR